MDRIDDLLHLGTVLHHQGRLNQARSIYQDILRRDPGHADALHLLGVIAGQTGDLQRAIGLIEEAIRIAPGNAPFHCNLGNCLRQAGRTAAAIASYDRAIAIDPGNVEAFVNRGNALLNARDFGTAVASYDRAIELKPALAEAYANRGFALQELNRFEASLASYDRAIELNPRYSQAYTSRGYVKQRMQQLDAAIEDYDSAIAVDPRNAEAHWNKALALLVGSRFDEGWKLYEWRWRRAHNRMRSFSQPMWRGTEPVIGKTVLLHSEQGIGDTIQFCRYARLVADRGARVVMEVPTPLLPLLQGLHGVDEWVERDAPLPQFDYHCPILSLPYAFKTRLETIPAGDAYLHADIKKIEQWSARLGTPKALRIGIAWSGNRAHQNDVQRSIGLAEFVGALWAGCEYVSLQRDVVDSDLHILRQKDNLRHFGDELVDFSDTAALCALVDLVVSVDTSVAHLAAAMGKTTWILLPFHPDWRWLLDRADSPWYPTAKLYRQSAAGDWGSVLARINADLEELSNQHGTR